MWTTVYTDGSQEVLLCEHTFRARLTPHTARPDVHKDRRVYINQRVGHNFRIEAIKNATPPLCDPTIRFLFDWNKQRHETLKWPRYPLMTAHYGEPDFESFCREVVDANSNKNDPPTVHRGRGTWSAWEYTKKPPRYPIEPNDSDEDESGEPTEQLGLAESHTTGQLYCLRHSPESEFDLMTWEEGYREVPFASWEQIHSLTEVWEAFPSGQWFWREYSSLEGAFSSVLHVTRATLLEDFIKWCKQMIADRNPNAYAP